MHLAHIHRTRGVAILCIVAMHCVDALDWSNNHQTYRFMVEVFQGTTVMFVMISGFLFEHLSDRFHYPSYLKTKFKNVVLPYLVVGLPGVLWFMSKPFFLEQNPELIGEPWWEQAAFLYLYGGSQLNHVLWFIPVLTIFYVFAPVFHFVIRHRTWFWTLVVLIPVSLLEHRATVQKYHHLELALYFLSAYMSGMLIGLYRQQVYAFCEKHFAALSAAFLLMLLGHFLLTDHVGSYVQEAFSSDNGLIDWIYVQKFILFFVVVTLLRRLDSRRMTTMDYVATVSFPIFFLHIYVLHVYSHLTHWQPHPGTFVGSMALLALVTACSAGLAYVTRTLFGRSSRMLIGA
ncbi:MAG: acyltransferase [Rubrivivax sp.]|nr:acyltransferase [Rubrivivax sp.]